ncbi:hypothetical protein ACFQDH_05630 [Flexivirga alba]|uniref:Uncharacterized protein n=2 Tax=Flexivirga alba TaxID=702742 RepID=A0ABW2AD54_9MICO
MQQVALAGSVGAAIAAAAVLGAAGSTATPVAASHSPGSHWYGAAGGASNWLPRAGADTSSSGSSTASTPSSTSAPTSTAASTSTPPASSSTTTSTNPNDPVSSGPGDEPENVEVTAAPGPCTQDDIAASRWSTRLTFTNPKDAGTLDYIALAINYNDNSENIDDYPHAGPVSVAAGETGSIVLTGPSDYFPDSLLVGGGVSADGQTAQTVGGIDIYDQADFLKAAKVCGNTTPTPDPMPSDPTDASSGYSGAATETKSETSTVTVTVTVTQTPPAAGPGLGEPPTPSPVTTRLGVTG